MTHTPAETVVVPEPAPVDPRIDAAGVVIVDVPCANCTYNLRTLTATAHCPECGNGVEDSLRDADVSMPDAAWLRRLARGATYLYVALSILPVTLTLVTYLLPMNMFVACVGAWWMTEPEPRSSKSRHSPVRILLRLLVCLSAAAAACIAIIDIYRQMTDDFVWFVPSIFELNPAFVFYMLGVLCLVSHLRQLAVRAGHSALMRHKTILLRVTLIDFVVVGGGPAVALVIAAMRSRGSTNAGIPNSNSFMESLRPMVGFFHVMGVAHGVTLLVLTYWLVVLLMRCSKTFRETIRAQANHSEVHAAVHSRSVE